MSNQRDWAYLFPEAIDTIVEKLDDSFPAFMSFISVCQHWRIVALEGRADMKKKKKSDNMQKLEILRTCRGQLPLLVVETHVHFYKVIRCFFTTTTPSSSSSSGICYYQLKNQHNLPPPGDIYYFGSCFGWLLAQKEESSSLPPMVDIALFNPLTGAVKCLPARWSEENCCYIGDCDKGVLSSDPCSKDGYELVVIHDKFRRLACYRSRTNSWMTIKVAGRVVDAVFYGGKVYAVNDLGDLFIVDFDRSKITRAVVAGFDRIPLQVGCPNVSIMHLAVSKHGRYLFMVEQIDVKYFKVFKLCCETWTWVEMIHGLGGEEEALFVGCKTRGSVWVISCFSACVSTLEFPQCRPNCIYYTYGPHLCDQERRGVFNLKLKQHFQMPLRVGGAGVGYSATQIWMVPNFKSN